MAQDESEPVDPLIGQVFGGKYTIVEKLGSGGMGGVYKAEQALMNRFVALKILRSTFHGDAVQMRRFQQEARTLSQLSHPNAVTVFDFGIENGLPYLVMEYIEGRTLKVVVREERRLPIPRVLQILRQACAALSEAHRLGIVHRDIKPDNIMLRTHHDGSDWVKVLDFGVAKSVLGTDPNLTQAGVLVGTPQYMSPEQCKGSELDARADIYSLGVVLYEMISGEVPFQAPSVLELLMKVMNSEPDSLRKFKPMLTTPASVDAVVLRSLAKNPEDRFQTMADFYSSFEKAAGGRRQEDSHSTGGLSKKAAAIMAAVGICLGAGMYLTLRYASDQGRAAELAAHQRALDAEKAVQAEKKRAEEEAARLKAEAAVKEAQAWQAEQERLKLEEEQKKLRQAAEAKQKEEQDRAKQLERELEAVKQRQLEMEQKMRDADRQKRELAEQRAEEERRKAEERRQSEQLSRKQRELEQKLEDSKRSREEAERAARRAREAAQRQAQNPPTQPPPQRMPERAETPVPVATPPRSSEEPNVRKPPRRRCGPTWCD